MNAPKYKVTIAIKNGGIYSTFFFSYERAKTFVLEMSERLDFGTIVEMGKGSLRRMVAGYSKTRGEFTEFATSWYNIED